ncbi:hypothetical protein A33Q_1125 [Indibacter alkaliphilus LW1]|uniref:UspA domain-containing protein n=1 Tax=Indibacter alkaliphilus (strain CCUG 57479 / KCTC 22604 / LW1) TaxID=1189612 RepID=S2E1W8_INDAL|nr:universal stress protein [Indibacter alkaliphilus]EOZ98471.1 hypothetical protein A33Q_1125 [Indibacter alkaliphilus LW1]
MSLKLIVPIDFSKYSLQQLRLAAAWKEKYGIEIMILHKVDLVFPSLANADLRLKMEYNLKREAKNNINELLEEVGLDINNETQIISGSLIEFFKNSPKVSKDDIIVLGIKGLDTFSRILIGSTATQLIDNLEHVIIGIPLDLKELVPEKLMIGTHYRKKIEPQVLRKLLSLFGSTLSYVELVSIIKSEDDAKEGGHYLSGIKSLIEDIVPSHFKLIEDKNPLEGLKKVYEEMEHSMLVVQRGSRSFSDQVSRKFLINELVYNSFAPIIILP